jgi:hypothetical protein
MSILSRRTDRKKLEKRTRFIQLRGSTVISNQFSNDMNRDSGIEIRATSKLSSSILICFSMIVFPWTFPGLITVLSNVSYYFMMERENDTFPILGISILRISQAISARAT